MKIYVGNIELNFEKKGSGKPLILIHGNGEDLHIFDELVESLKNDFTIYSIDMRNHGKSSMTDDFDYSIMAYDLYLFIQKLRIEKPFFFGFSDGGILGLLLSIAYPDLFKKVVVAGANMNPKGILPRITKISLENYEKTKSPYEKMMIEQPNIRNQDLNKIKTPVMVLAGEFDIVRETHTKRIARHIKNSTSIIIPKRAHHDYIVHTDELKDILKGFYYSI